MSVTHAGIDWCEHYPSRWHMSVKSLNGYIVRMKASAAMQAVAAKLKKKKTDITVDKIVEDEPLEFGAQKDDEELEEIEARLPAEDVWEREALISTKSEPLAEAHCTESNFKCQHEWLAEKCAPKNFVRVRISPFLNPCMAL